MTNRNMGNTVERKIYLFRADAGRDSAGGALDFDHADAMAKIRELPFTDDDRGRYLFDTDGNALCAFPGDRSPDHTLRFGRVRRTGLPQLEQGGSVTDLLLRTDQGLIEPIHVVFFSGNIVGVEYNHYAPRLSTFANYLRTKGLCDEPAVAFRPLLRCDAADQLDRLNEIRLLEFTIRPAYVDTVRRAERSLGEAFAANAQAVNNPDTVHLKLAISRVDRLSMLTKVVGPLKGLMGTGDLSQNVLKLQVRGQCLDTGRVETLDLLQDHLISTKRIVKLTPRGRALDSLSAFDAITESHDELQPELLRAAEAIAS